MEAGGGGGAGAGIGGNGGKGGDANSTEKASNGHNMEFVNQPPKDGSNPDNNTNCARDGENGNDCGVVNIEGNLQVYAYGGNGGSGGNGVSSSGGGGRRLSSSWNRRRPELVEAGGYHYDGAGGFSGGGAQGNPVNGVNGNGGGSNETSGSGGGGYYTRGKGYSSKNKGTSVIGGQNGAPCISSKESNYWYKDIGGDGGKAGAGGKVYYTNANNIIAYNGSMITNNDYNTAYYEYNKDGSTTSNKLTVIKKPNGENTIPAKIFAQSGTIRETYTTNTGAFTLSKVKTGVALPAIANSYASVQLVKATNEENTSTTGYNNGYMDNQGIGSGAGYLESSNGVFEKK